MPSDGPSRDPRSSLSGRDRGRRRGRRPRRGPRAIARRRRRGLGADDARDLPPGPGPAGPELVAASTDVGPSAGRLAGRGRRIAAHPFAEAAAGRTATVRSRRPTRVRRRDRSAPTCRWSSRSGGVEASRRRRSGWAGRRRTIVGRRPSEALVAPSPTLAALAVDRARLASTAAERSEWFERLAHTDPLTGLANERTVARILELELARAGRQGSEVSLAIFDVDDFRATNDERRARGRRRRPARGRGRPRRIGPARRHRRPDRRRRVPARRARARPGAMVARRVLDGIAALPAVAGRTVSVSAGVARFPADGTDAGDADRGAPTARARARARGRGSRAAVAEAEIDPSAGRGQPSSSRPAAARDARDDRSAAVGAVAPGPARGSGRGRSRSSAAGRSPERRRPARADREAAERTGSRRRRSPRPRRPRSRSSARRSASRSAIVDRRRRVAAMPPAGPAACAGGRTATSDARAGRRRRGPRDALFVRLRAVELTLEQQVPAAEGDDREDGRDPQRPSRARHRPSRAAARCVALGGGRERGRRGSARGVRGRGRRRAASARRPRARSAAAAARIRRLQRRPAARPRARARRAPAARTPSSAISAWAVGQRRQVRAHGRRLVRLQRAEHERGAPARRTSSWVRSLRPSRVGHAPVGLLPVGARPRPPGAPAHRQQPEPHPALDRPERRRRPLGDLLLGQARRSRRARSPRAGRRRGRPSAPRTVSASRPPRPRPTCRAAAARPAAASSRSGSSVVGPAPADGVDRAVVDDREQPRLHAAAALDVAGGIAPRAEEGVLDDVLGERGVIRDAVGDRVGHGLVSVVQLFEGVELAVGDPRQHRPIRVVGDGRDAKRERPARLGHRVMRTAAGSGSPVAPSAASSHRASDPRPRRRPPAGGRVDDRERAPARPRRCARNPSRTRSMEGEVELGLEAGDVAGRLARQPDLDRQVEQDRQVRREAAGRGVREGAQVGRAARRRRSPGRPASSRRTGRRPRSSRRSARAG